MSTKLTHFDKQGRSRMVDVTEKENTVREAVAKGDVYMKAETFNMIMDRKISKGDVLGVAQTAGIMGAKKPVNLFPCVIHLTLHLLKFLLLLIKEMQGWYNCTCKTVRQDRRRNGSLDSCLYGCPYDL